MRRAWGTRPAQNAMLRQWGAGWRPQRPVAVSGGSVSVRAHVQRGHAVRAYTRRRLGPEARSLLASYRGYRKNWRYLAFRGSPAVNFNAKTFARQMVRRTILRQRFGLIEGHEVI